MKAQFGMERELDDRLFYKECKNDSGDFHFHSQVEICLVDEGEMEVVINENRKILKKGEMSIALSYDAHFYKPVNYSETSLLIIPVHMCSEFVTAVSQRKIINPFICNQEIFTVVKNYFNKIKEEAENEITLRGYIYLILGLVIKNICMENVNIPISHDLSSKLIYFIHNNYKNDISLKSISHKLGYNPSYISRCFKSQFNIGIKEYLTIVRLKKSIALMHEKKHSITYCALEGGFNSLRTFYRAFLNEFHCTPNEYLKKDIKSSS